MYFFIFLCVHYVLLTRHLCNSSCTSFLDLQSPLLHFSVYLLIEYTIMEPTYYSSSMSSLIFQLLCSWYTVYTFTYYYRNTLLSEHPYRGPTLDKVHFQEGVDSSAKAKVWNLQTFVDYLLLYFLCTLSWNQHLVLLSCLFCDFLPCSLLNTSYIYYFF